MLCSLAGYISLPFFLSFLALQNIPHSVAFTPLFSRLSTDSPDVSARNKLYGPEALRTSVISDYINFSRHQVRPLTSPEMISNWLPPHPCQDNRFTVAWMQEIYICISVISPVVSSQPSAVRCHLWAVFTDIISFDSPSMSVLVLSFCCPVKPLSGARLPYTHRQWSPQYNLRSEIKRIWFPLSALENKLCKATCQAQCCIKWSACRLKLLISQENAKWESLGDDSMHCSTIYIPAEQCFLQNVHACSLWLVPRLQLSDARISLSLGWCHLPRAVSAAGSNTAPALDDTLTFSTHGLVFSSLVVIHWLSHRGNMNTLWFKVLSNHRAAWLARQSCNRSIVHCSSHLLLIPLFLLPI